jgi:hypothetical protein
MERNNAPKSGPLVPPARISSVDNRAKAAPAVSVEADQLASVLATRCKGALTLSPKSPSPARRSSAVSSSTLSAKRAQKLATQALAPDGSRALSLSRSLIALRRLGGCSPRECWSADGGVPEIEQLVVDPDEGD